MINLREPFICFGAAIVLVACLTSESRAEARFGASLSVREEYNDNILLTKENRQDDFITTVSPSIVLGYKTSLMDLALDYGLIFKFYLNHNEKNETSLNGAQRAKLDTTMQPSRYLSIKLFDEYKRVPIDAKRASTVNNTLVNLTDANTFRVNPQLQYPLGSSLSLTSGYMYENNWYRTNGNNAQNHTVTAQLNKEISRNLQLWLSYGYTFHRPSDTALGNVDDTYDLQQGSVGGSWQIMPKLTVTGSVGKVFYYYENRPNTNSLNLNASGSYQISDALSINGGYAEGFSSSVTKGVVRTKSTTGGLNYAGNLTMGLAGFHTIGDYQETNREDRTTGTTVSLGIPLTSSIKLQASGNYAYREFLPDGETSHRYGGTVSFSYPLRLVTISCGYSYDVNDSSSDFNSFKNNIAWIQTGISY